MKTVFWYMKAIIISDDQLLSRVLKVILKSIGFERVEAVGDLLELRQRQADPRHDLIIADSELRGLDGADLLLLTRADPVLAPSLFIIVTEDTSFRFFEKCMRRGADAVVHKPVAPEDLTGAVVRLLASRRAWRAKVVPHPRSLPHQASLEEGVVEPRP
jgi:two-component system chemotaxis response regulator CheY